MRLRFQEDGVDILSIFLSIITIKTLDTTYRQAQVDLERSGEESRLGPEEQRSGEFPGPSFGLKSFNLGDEPAVRKHQQVQTL